ncbi:MAG: DUF202 domain-containing protein [Sumerlaeia bacterium]
MKTKPARYSEYESSPLILRDQLAIDRTLLANERTLLAYLRSAVALLIAGVTMMHFAEHGWFFMAVVFCIPVGFIGAAIGSSRYVKMDQSIRTIRKRMPALPNTNAAATTPAANVDGPDNI